MMSYNRSAAKDALAWTILHGGYFVVKTALTTGGVAAGIIDKYTARQITKLLGKLSPSLKRTAWSHYEKTGNIWEMVELAAGNKL